MNKITGTLVLLAVLQLAVTARGQVDPQAQAVIDRYLEALGSEMELASVESIRVSGQLELTGRPDRIPFTILELEDRHWNCLHTGPDLVVIANGPVVWSKVGDQPPSPLPPEAGTGHPSDSLPNPMTILQWQRRLENIQYKGQTEIEGVTCDHLAFTTRRDDVIQRYFDVESALLVYQEARSGRLVYSQEFEYRDVEGVLCITRAHVTIDGKPYSTATYEYELNAEVDASIFEIPEEIKRQVIDKNNGHPPDQSEDRHGPRSGTSFPGLVRLFTTKSGC